MAKTKPSSKRDKRQDKGNFKRGAGSPSQNHSPPMSPENLLLEAANALQQGDIENAIKPAKKALKLLDSASQEALPALNILGNLHMEIGDVASARKYFLKAAALDGDGSLGEEVGGGAEKFLWLAQLSEEGGQDSVDWFEKGATSLRTQIQALLNRKHLDLEGAALLEEKKRKLATALCGVAEVYMTDLSWESDAEQICETLVTEATMVAEGYAEPWQTLANVRISQERVGDARAALTRSLDLWKDLEPGNHKVPEFPARVSLARLLMEAGMDFEAIEVLERLVGEDDQSVEVWYLGGWGLFILGEKQKSGEVKIEDGEGESWTLSWISSRQWLIQSLRLFEQQDYEDQRLGEHAKELLSAVNKELGEDTNSGEDEEAGAWGDEDDSDEDGEMIEA